MTPTLREPVREHWMVRRSCPECATDVVWVADAASRDLLALHREVCHGQGVRAG
jgi:hypothetical protein